MTGTTCTACGAPLAPGVQFCAYCGRPVAYPRSQSGPLRTATLGGPGPSAPVAAPVPNWVAPAPRRRPRWMVVVAVFVVLILLVGVAGFYLVDNAETVVQVTEMVVYAPDDVCGLGLGLYGYDGFSGAPGGHVAFELPVEDLNSTTCTIRGVATNTSGFQVTAVQPSDTIAGRQNGTLNLTLELPGGSFDGALNLVFR